MPLAELLIDSIRERGPLTVAAFMDLALYHPEFGYYARAVQRSGRAGDFFTSVDVGAIFGELVEIQIAEMARLLTTTTAQDQSDRFDLVEAGAGNGRLSADILRACRQRDPDVYARLQLHLIESSAAACAAHHSTLGDAAERIASSNVSLPSSFEGVLIANELLDALPVHQVVMRPDGLREVYVDVAPGRDNAPDSHLVTREGPLSTPALAEYLQRLGAVLEPGWRAEINLRALDWIREAARKLRRGFIILIDYGHEARDLYSVTHAGGTLTTFVRHTMAGPDAAGTAAWLSNPGEQDITAHVDFTAVRHAAEAEGLVTLGFLDQTYFLMGLLSARGSEGSQGSAGSKGPEEGPEGSQGSAHANPANLVNLVNPKARFALKTLLMPGGLGSTFKVLIFGKGVGTPALAGCSYRMRVT